MSFVPTSLVGERSIEGNVFPLTLQWNNSLHDISDLTTWLNDNQDNIDSQLRQHKAILFRCANLVPTHEHFHRFVETLQYHCMDYIGGAAVRTQLTDRVFTANESPATENIPFHHEMAQTPQPPTHLYFFCETAPTSGGETPILVSAEVCSTMRQLHPDFMRELGQYGVKYVRYLPEFDDPSSAIGRGWRSTFQCIDRGTVRRIIVAIGTTMRGECLQFTYSTYNSLFLSYVILVCDF